MGLLRLSRSAVAAAAIIALSLSALVVVTPAFAADPVTTWSGNIPAAGSTLAGPVATFKIDAACTARLNAASKVVKVDGVTQPASCFAGSKPVGGLYRASVYWPTGFPAADGLHTISVTLGNYASPTPATTTWDYRVAIPPTLGTPSPAAGALIATTTPVITVPATDNGVIASVTATVAGVPAPAMYSNGLVYVYPTAELPNDASTAVSVTVTDLAGNAASKSWSFEVQIYADMDAATIQDCGSCHPEKTDPAHNMNADCDDCHYDAPHSGLPTQLHARADVSRCTGCHVSSITAEHNRYALDCATCHGQGASGAVKAAVAAGDTQCAACHDGHGAQHTNSAMTCSGAGCHNGTTLTSVHKAIGCACHDSTDDKVTSAISGHDRDCTACHNPVVVHGAVHSASTTYQGYVATTGGYYRLACTSCHRVNLLANHGSDYTNCSMCHESGGPRASFTTWNKTCQTGACHPPTSTIEGLAVAPHPTPTVPMDHRLVAPGYQAPPYCFQCHNSSVPQCGSAYGCHANVVPPATSVDYTPPRTLVSQISSEPITWSLDATDVGDGVTETYYSFDGAPFALYGETERLNGITNPADASPPYAHTLRYYSVDAAGNIEVIQTKEYNVTDNTPPVVSFNGVSLGGGTFAAKSLVMSVSDPKVGGFNTGVAFVHTEVKTYKTNWGWFPFQAFYQPMADFTYPQDSSWDTTRAIQPVEQYAIAKSSPGLWPTYQDFGTGGRFEIQYYARDYAGNQTPLTYAYLWVDNGAPVTTPAKVTGVYRWKLNAVDTHVAGVAATYYSFDGGPFALYTAADASAGVGNTQPGGEAAGDHRLEYYSVDTLGNTESTKTLNYTIP